MHQLTNTLCLQTETSTQQSKLAPTLTATPSCSSPRHHIRRHAITFVSFITFVPTSLQSSPRQHILTFVSTSSQLFPRHHNRIHVITIVSTSSHSSPRHHIRRHVIAFVSTATSSRFQIINNGLTATVSSLQQNYISM